MKALNNKEIKENRLKFFGMYSISIILIVIIMCSFLVSKPVIKTIVVQKTKTETKYLTAIAKKPAMTSNKIKTNDSLKDIEFVNDKKIAALNESLNNQNKVILKLQDELKLNKQNKNSGSGKNEITALNKQIEFLNWAVRSQVVETNTLTKENINLKSNIAQLTKELNEARNK